MKIFLTVLTVVVLGLSQFALAKPLSRGAGDTLLQSFSCDTVGDKTHEVMSSLGTLKDTVASINETSKQCADLSKAISNLPKIEDIMGAIQNDSVSKEIREQEGLVNEALADLNTIEKLPADQRDLYPSRDDIRITISTARAKLYELRPRLGIERAALSKQKYNDGINELNTLATRVVSAMSQDNECFGGNTQLKRRAVTGVLGISGFFLSEPIGIATNLAGRLMQQVFDMAAASNDPVKKAFEPSEDLTLIFGLGCAMENLSKQHCRIVKELEITAVTEAGSCAECDAATKDARSLTKLETDIKQIQVASTAREQLDEASETGGAQRKAVKEVLSEIQETKAALSRAKKEAQKYDAKNQALYLPDQILTALGNVAKQINDTAKYINKDPNAMYSSTPEKPDDAVTSGYKRAGFSAEDSRQDVLLFILGDEVDRNSELKNLHDGLAAGLTDYELSNFNSYQTSAGAMLRYAFKAERRTATVDKLRQKLSQPAVVDEISARLQAYDQRLRATIKGAGGEDSLRQWTATFLGGETSDMSRRSPYQSLKNIESFMRNLPEGFKNSENHGKLFTNDSDMERVSSLVKKADALRAKGTYDDAELNDLQQDFVGLVGNELEFFQRFDALGKRLDRYQQQNLQTQLDKSTDPTQMRGLMYALHQDVMRDALTVSDADTVTGRKDKLNNAKAMSATALEAFGSAFKDYLERAFDFFGKADKNPGLKGDVDPSIKATLCMQMLGLSDLKGIEKMCAGTQKESQGLTLKFDEAKKLPRDQRVCVFDQFVKHQKSREIIRRQK